MDQQEWKHRRKQKSFKRSQRKKQIIKTLTDWKQMQYADEATSYMLADALEMTPSPYLRDMLNEMVAEGLLECVERDQSGRFTTKFYLLATSPLITEKYFHRQIRVNKRGQNVGQLEMFQ